MSSIKAFDVMTSRGFTSVDTLTSGETLYGIYYNAKTHQCVQLANANDRVDSAVDIHTHPKCKCQTLRRNRGLTPFQRHLNRISADPVSSATRLNKENTPQ